MKQFKEVGKATQVLAGAGLLVIAVTAGATGLAINVLHGLEVSIAAAILFGLADLTKIVLPIVCGIVGWSKQTKLTAIVCVATSLFCASSAYIDGAGKNLAGKQHSADQYAAAKADVVRIEKEIESLDNQAAAEAKNGGCGKNCKYLGERADKARVQLAEAKQDLKNAKPVDVTGNERLKAIITTVLYLTLIEALVMLSIPAMALLTMKQAQKVEERKTAKVVEQIKQEALKPVRTKEQRSQAAKKGWDTRRAKVQKKDWTKAASYLEPKVELETV